MKNVIIATALFFAAWYWFILKNKTITKPAATVPPVAPVAPATPVAPVATVRLVATVPPVKPVYYPEPAVLTKNTPQPSPAYLAEETYFEGQQLTTERRPPRKDILYY